MGIFVQQGRFIVSNIDFILAKTKINYRLQDEKADLFLRFKKPTSLLLEISSS